MLGFFAVSHATARTQRPLPHDVLAKFSRLRGPGDSYSDAILALAEAAGT
jgi:hypothetical protein